MQIWIKWINHMLREWYKRITIQLRILYLITTTIDLIVNGSVNEKSTIKTAM